jgi:hypothetical protein
VKKLPIVYAQTTPQRMGAKNCPNCKTSELRLEIKTIAAGTHFAEVTCLECYREAISDVHTRTAAGVVQAIERWNSIWPDVSGYLESDTEGIRYDYNPRL